MKTKIVYISGAEVFEMAEVRSAFDEVRNTLGLDKDTILFGVPVDADDSFSSEEPVENTPEIQETQIIAEKKSRKKSVKKHSVTEDITDTDDQLKTNDSSKVIPILSVLSSNEKKNDDYIQETDYVSPIESIDEQTIVTGAQIQDIDEIFDPQENIEVSDIVSEEKQTLEHLFDSIAPLDDVVEDLSTDVDDTNTADMNTDVLGQLATEFVENADSIQTTKPVSHGTISRLKNIIPFKREKKNTTSDLVNDLFGWAGDAANDDDLSDFFSTGTSSNR